MGTCSLWLSVSLKFSKLQVKHRSNSSRLLATKMPLRGSCVQFTDIQQKKWKKALLTWIKWVSCLLHFEFKIFFFKAMVIINKLNCLEDTKKNVNHMEVWDGFMNIGIYLILLHFTDTVFFFSHKLKIHGHPALSKSIDTFFPTI